MGSFRRFLHRDIKSMVIAGSGDDGGRMAGNGVHTKASGAAISVELVGKMGGVDFRGPRVYFLLEGCM